MAAKANSPCSLAKASLDLVSPLQAFDQGGRARAFATMIEGLSAAKTAGLSPEVVKAALAFIDDGVPAPT